MRAWIKSGNRILFDIADIEAHSPAGEAQTFSLKSRTCQRLYRKYTTDGGHLNDKGAQAVALGVYAVTASLMGSEAITPVASARPTGLGCLGMIGGIILSAGLAVFQMRRFRHKARSP